jgi:enoyl-CoA hydratase
VLDGMSGSPEPSPLPARRAAIDRLFAVPSLVALRDALSAAAAGGEEWIGAAVTALGRASPTSLAVTFRQFREGRDLPIEAILLIENRLAQRIARGPDFLEGVRAILIDKDNAPRWNPPTLEQLDDTAIARYFDPLEPGEPELHLP